MDWAMIAAACSVLGVPVVWLVARCWPTAPPTCQAFRLAMEQRSTWYCERCAHMVAVDVWQTNVLCDVVCAECGEILHTSAHGGEG